MSNYKFQLVQELITLLENQIMDLTLMSKIELGDDVIAEISRLKSLINIDMIDELIKEGEAHLKYYEEVKESMLADNDIPIRIKEIYIGLSEALRPTLDLLYKEREKYESY